MPEAVTVGLWGSSAITRGNAMSIYLTYNALTARTEAENLARRQFDAEGFVVRDEPLRTRVASLLRRIADMQIALAARLDDSSVQPLAA
jgi:hypothetical protein